MLGKPAWSVNCRIHGRFQPPLACSTLIARISTTVSKSGCYFRLITYTSTLLLRAWLRSLRSLLSHGCDVVWVLKHYTACCCFARFSYAVVAPLAPVTWTFELAACMSIGWGQCVTKQVIMYQIPLYICSTYGAVIWSCSSGRVQACTLGHRIYTALCSDIGFACQHLRTWLPYTLVEATFVESLQRPGRYHWSGEVLF